MAAEPCPRSRSVFAFILVGYGIWDLDQLSGRRYAAGARVSLAGIGAVGLPCWPDAEHRVAVPRGPLGCRAGPRCAPERARRAAMSSAAAVPVAEEPPRAGGPHPGGRGAFLLSPAVTVGCRITMGIVMAFMLMARKLPPDWGSREQDDLA